MKNSFYAIFFAAIFANYAADAQSKQAKTDVINVTIDLNVVKDDRVMVSVMPPKVTTESVTYNIPKIIPGTYSEDDYGKFIQDVAAFDANGKPLVVTKNDENSWNIANAKKLSKITYWVNDTYDVEKTHDIFSPAGTNILEGKNFMLNMHGFVGYFENSKTTPYVVTITHPSSLLAATSLVDTDPAATRDVFNAARYAVLIDNPVMYSKPDQATFKVDDMDITIAVYSPNNVYSAASISGDMETMMRAQKKFLGPVNTTKKYSVLLYLSDMKTNDAEGFGALEHNTSTTVSFPEMMPKDQLAQSMIDVVSHEFFHIVTPLSVHSKEIHDFDFNQPKMSKHLWMYEGVTEYFANLFQVNQGLISEDDFYGRMAAKITNAATMNDQMSFTTMSANVLQEPYKGQYLNVYEKGALIGMCLDIIIREQSNGQRGVLDLMQKLSTIYGPERPFEDDELFAKIIELTYPQVGTFIKTHIEGTTPIPYDQYFAKVGVTTAKKQVPENVFLKGQTPYIALSPTGNEISVVPGSELNNFMRGLKLKGGDVITAINGTPFSRENALEVIMASQSWKEGDNVLFAITRDGKPMELKGKVVFDYKEVEGLQATDGSKDPLKQAWLKG